MLIEEGVMKSWESIPGLLLTMLRGDPENRSAALGRARMIFKVKFEKRPFGGKNQE
jgi:hypothetical protein